MKRSEVVDVIAEFLYQVGDEDKMPFGLDYEADRLLGWLEKRGWKGWEYESQGAWGSIADATGISTDDA